MGTEHEHENALTYVFNKFLIDFVKALNKTDPELKAITKRNYRVIDKMSSDFIDGLDGRMDAETVQHVLESPPKGLLLLPKVSELEVLKDLPVKTILLKADASFHSTVRFYLYVFSLLLHVRRTEHEETIPKMLPCILEIVKSIQSGDSFQAKMESLVDDDYRTLVQHIYDNEHADSDSDEGAGDAGDSLLSSLENSTIGALAKEISKDIDLASLNIDRPEDLLNMANFTNQNSPIGGIIQKVGATLQSKLQSGEIKHDQLLGEAFDFMKTLNMAGAAGGGAGGGNPLADMLNNPILKGMMGNLGNMAAAAPKRESGTRDRLRRKLDEKKRVA